jgi:hypothetical protein
VPIERPPTVEEVIDELRARLTLVASRAQEDGEVARVRGPSATGLGLPTVLSSRLSHRTNPTGRRPSVYERPLSQCATCRSDARVT